MASLPSLYFSVFLCFIFFYVSYVNGGEPQRHHLITVSSLLPSTNCYSSSSLDAASGENRLKVVHRHGPCSPLGQQKQRNHGRVLLQDRHRVQSLHRRVSTRSRLGSSVAAVTVPGRSGISLGNGDYVVTVGFGTPKRDMSVIFDTGSDITWIQCEPCATSCYRQKEPLFDPTVSSTFSMLSCDSDYCSGDATVCASSTCIYRVKYGDGSHSNGLLAQDTLTLTPSDVLNDFVFGCGKDNDGLFGEVAGLIGLGRDKVSLVSQASQTYGGAFSYCLPPFASSAGYLTLGPDKHSPSIQFTSLLSNPDVPSFYFVELIGLSVGGKDLKIPPANFTNVGTIIDSGTVLTYLSPGAYSALRSEFRRRMAMYRSAQPVDVLDTCYDLTGHDRVAVPEVALRFSGGVNLNVDPSGILYVVDISQACLAFVANSDTSALSIIGNMQQKTYNVVYDAPNGRIGFGAGGCG